MSKILRIEIAMDNAAFEDTPNAEVARILLGYIDRIEIADGLDCRLQDINGNHVGDAVEWEYQS